MRWILLVSISQIVSSIKMRLAGANWCVIAKKQGWKWKPHAGPYHMDLECILAPWSMPQHWHHQYRKYNSRHIRGVSHQVKTMTRNSKMAFIGIHRIRAIYESSEVCLRPRPQLNVKLHLRTLKKLADASTSADGSTSAHLWSMMLPWGEEWWSCGQNVLYLALQQ